MRLAFSPERPLWAWVTPTPLTLAVAIAVASALILWGSPLAPLLLIGGAVAMAGALVLLQYPLATCYMAAFLILLPFGARPGGVPLDLFYTLVVNGAILLALLGLLLEVVRERQEMVLSPTCMAMGLFIGWALTTMLWASALVEARKTLVEYCVGLTMLFVLTNQTRNPRALDSFMTVLRVLGWFLIAAGLYALLTNRYESGTRLKILDMNENEFGLVAIITVPGVLWPVMRGQGLRRRIDMALSLVFLLLALILIALTGSRGSSLSLLLVMLSFLFSRSLRPWGVSSLVVLLLLLAVAPFVLSTVIERFTDEQGGEFGGRDVLWRAGLMLIGDVPWTGVGIGNGPLKLHNYIASLTGYFNNRTDLPTHNPLLEVGVDTGIVGMCLYAAAIAAAFWQFCSERARDNLRANGLAGYFPLILGISVGYFAGWIKGGGVENHPSFFAMLALLLFPSQLGSPLGSGFQERQAPTAKSCRLAGDRDAHA